jgi:phospholipid/cholesterol/gamma-HCH transport system substrate-binding protein
MTRIKLPNIKPLGERNRVVVGAVGILVLVVAVIAVFS